MAAPVISYFTPPYGPTGQWVYIFGSNFVDGGTSVFYDNVQQSSVYVYDQSQLGFYVTPGVTGLSVFTVTTSGGLSNSNDQFLIQSPGTDPVIYYITPYSNPSVNWVYVYGDGFIFNETTVSYNDGLDDFQAPRVMVYSPTQLGFSKDSIGDSISSIVVATTIGTTFYP